MDSKTKALLQQGELHTQGAVMASYDKPHMMHKVEVFPPHMSFVVSEHVLKDTLSSAQATLDLAQHISKSVAAIVEKQILAVFETDAKAAIKAVYEEKKAALNDPNMLWFPKKVDKKGTIWEHVFINLSEPAPVTYQSLKDAVTNLKDTQHGHIQFANKFFNAPLPAAEPFPENEAERNDIVAIFHDHIPGFATMRQACPVNDGESCRGYTGPFLQYTIIHLNDHHRWTREAIAEWLETLDHDLTFKTLEEVTQHNEHEDAMAEYVKKLMSDVPPLDPSIFMGNTETSEEVNNGNSD